MSTPIQVQAAQRQIKLMGYKGIVGLGWNGKQVVVYVESDDVIIPLSLAGYPTLKKVSGKIGLLK